MLSALKTYWSNNSTLNAALPASKVYLDLVPANTTFPYARLTVIANTKIDTTSVSHIEQLSYQIAMFHTDFDALTATVNTLIGQLDNAQITPLTLRNRRTNKLPQCEVVNGKFTYNWVVEYMWTYNSTTV